jgi:dynamin-like GTPase MGM1, mitochondrial
MDFPIFRGTNMVTRRPLELTMVNTPSVSDDYAEFPDLGLRGIKDFDLVSRTLRELNSAVAEQDCVSEEPIRLRIYSNSVPDLSLIDLPGYIRVNTVNQPLELQEKIRSLCQKYLKSPNIILAVSSADIDLANSEALRESRKVDPLGKRTIGVLTKMDLIEPNLGINLLLNKEYPLDLGYVGIVCRDTERRLGFLNPSRISETLEMESKRKGLRFGVTSLRDRLSHVIADRMLQSLSRLDEQVQMEINETKYQLAAISNSRYLTAFEYVADLLDTLKTHVRDLNRTCDREYLRSMIRASMLDLPDELFRDSTLSNISSVSDRNSSYNRNEAERTVSLLARSRLGKKTTQLASDVVLSLLEKQLSLHELEPHPQLHKDLSAIARDLLTSLSPSVAERIELHLKPLKHEIDYDRTEWANAYSECRRVIEAKIKVLTRELLEIQRNSESGDPLSRKSTSTSLLTRWTTSADTSRPKSPDFKNDSEELHLSPTHIKLSTMEDRLKYIKRNCKLKDNAAQCAEVVFILMADKLATSAANLISIDLVNEFLHRYPRELDAKFLYQSKPIEIDRIARQNPHVREQLDLQETLRKLEMAHNKIIDVLRDQHLNSLVVE